MKEDIKILLDRRKKILDKINKLQKEYTALGNVITELYRYEEKKGRDDNERW